MPGRLRAVQDEKEDEPEDGEKEGQVEEEAVGVCQVQDGLKLT